MPAPTSAWAARGSSRGLAARHLAGREQREAEYGGHDHPHRRRRPAAFDRIADQQHAADREGDPRDPDQEAAGDQPLELVAEQFRRLGRGFLALLFQRPVAGHRVPVRRWRHGPRHPGGQLARRDRLGGVGRRRGRVGRLGRCRAVRSTRVDGLFEPLQPCRLAEVHDEEGDQPDEEDDLHAVRLAGAASPVRRKSTKPANARRGIAAGR